MGARPVERRVEREVRVIKADAKKRYTLGVVYEPGVGGPQVPLERRREIESSPASSSGLCGSVATR